MPNTALKVAQTDTELASYGAQRAKTGTPFFGYIIATTLENTDFGDFFHNQIATAWLAFLNAPCLVYTYQSPRYDTMYLVLRLLL